MHPWYLYWNWLARSPFVGDPDEYGWRGIDSPGAYVGQGAQLWQPAQTAIAAKGVITRWHVLLVTNLNQLVSTNQAGVPINTWPTASFTSEQNAKGYVKAIINYSMSYQGKPPITYYPKGTRIFVWGTGVNLPSQYSHGILLKTFSFLGPQIGHEGWISPGNQPWTSLL